MITSCALIVLHSTVCADSSYIASWHLHGQAVEEQFRLRKHGQRVTEVPLDSFRKARKQLIISPCGSNMPGLEMLNILYQLS